MIPRSSARNLSTLNQYHVVHLALLRLIPREKLLDQNNTACYILRVSFYTTEVYSPSPVPSPSHTQNLSIEELGVSIQEESTSCWVSLWVYLPPDSFLPSASRSSVSSLSREEPVDNFILPTLLPYSPAVVDHLHSYFQCLCR